MSKFKVGDKVRRNGNDPEAVYDFEGEIGTVTEGDIVEISSVSNDVYSVKGSRMENTPNWDSMEQNFDLVEERPKPKMDLAVDILLIKRIREEIKNNNFESYDRDSFDGRSMQGDNPVFAQITKDKDVLKKDKTIMGGVRYTSSLREIDRNKDFFVHYGGRLYLYGDKKMALFKDISLLKMASPEIREKKKPKSLYNITSKKTDPDLLITIKKLIQVTKDCDIDADIFFALESIRTKKELIETINSINMESDRKYDENARHILKTLQHLVKELE